MMKTKNIFALLVVGALAFTSCKKELEPQESSGIALPANAEASNAAQTGPQQVPTAAPGTTPQMVQSPNGMMQVNSQPVAAAAAAKGMNPAHGQPGHRCDIPVGAPLNSPPGTAAAQPAQKMQTIPTQGTTPNGQPYTITPAKMNADGTLSSAGAASGAAPAILAAPTTTAPGMNPPHGQDGHRCDVAVGAPFPKS